MEQIFTKEQIKAWEHDSLDTLTSLNLDKHDKETYILAGAALAHLAHSQRHADEPVTAEQNIKIVTPSNNEPTEVSPLQSLINDLQSGLEKYGTDKGNYVQNPTSDNLDLELADLRNVLGTMSELYFLLVSGSSKEEKEVIKSSLKGIVKKLGI